MLDLRPNCECCDHALPNEALAWICSYECTFCAACACGHLDQTCPNCGGELVPRPRRPGEGRQKAKVDCLGYPKTPIITAGRVRLRAFDEADLPILMAYRNDPQTARYQSWTGMTEAQARAFWVEQRSRRLGEPGGWTQLTVELRETNEVIGDCAMHVETYPPRSARIGYTFARAFQGRGLATEAVGALVQHGFAKLGLHRITAHTDARNAASIALLERLGFKCEAKFEQADWFKGEWVDEWVYVRRA